MSYSNSKPLYYFKNVIRYLIPKWFSRIRLKSILAKGSTYDRAYVEGRVNYYIKLNTISKLSDQAICIGRFKIPKRLRVYFFDTYQWLRFFSTKLRFYYIPGDVTKVPDEPSFVKSRPVNGDLSNAILLNMDKVRHFNFISDPIPLEDKDDKMVWRGHIAPYQKHRVKFMEMYFDHPLCNIGKTNQNHESLAMFQKEKMSIPEHLKYKFVLSIEGNDVATNLKWVMSSNSVAVMPKPVYETWFMEGTLIPDFHYICIKDDYSDLEERLQYFINNPEKMQQIVANAHKYISQFQDAKLERYISLQVAEKYFQQTGQI